MGELLSTGIIIDDILFMTIYISTYECQKIYMTGIVCVFYVKDFNRHKLINGGKSEPFIPEISQIIISICHIQIKNKFTTRILTSKVR